MSYMILPIQHCIYYGWNCAGLHSLVNTVCVVILYINYKYRRVFNIKVQFFNYFDKTFLQLTFDTIKTSLRLPCVQKKYSLKHFQNMKSLLLLSINKYVRYIVNKSFKVFFVVHQSLKRSLIVREIGEYELLSKQTCHKYKVNITEAVSFRAVWSRG